jgi:hypothetical protein
MDDILNKQESKAYQIIYVTLSDQGKQAADAIVQYLIESNIVLYNTHVDYNPLDDDNYVETYNYSEDKILGLIEASKTHALTFDFCRYLSGKHLGRSKNLDEFARKVLQKKVKRPSNKAGKKTLNQLRNALICIAVAMGNRFQIPLYNDDCTETACSITQEILLAVFGITCQVKNIWIDRNK